MSSSTKNLELVVSRMHTTVTQKTYQVNCAIWLSFFQVLETLTLIDQACFNCRIHKSCPAPSHHQNHLRSTFSLSLSLMLCTDLLQNAVENFHSQSPTNKQSINQSNKTFKDSWIQGFSSSNPPLLEDASSTKSIMAHLTVPHIILSR